MPGEQRRLLKDPFSLVHLCVFPWKLLFRLRFCLQAGSLLAVLILSFLSWERALLPPSGLPWLKLVFASIGFRDGRSPSFVALGLSLSLDLQLRHSLLSACRFGHLFLLAFWSVTSLGSLSSVLSRFSASTMFTLVPRRFVIGLGFACGVASFFQPADLGPEG
jgi:hypothetical protein